MSKLDVMIATRKLMLITAQKRQWPDSRILPMSDVYREWLNFDRITSSFYKNQMLMGLTMCLQHPVIVYYECGFDIDKQKFLYRGARYGYKAEEYYSGFPAPL